MIKRLTLAVILLSSGAALSQSRLYANRFLSHLHENPDKNSTSLTIVQCSHSVKVLKLKNRIPGWHYAQVGEDKGYIQEGLLSPKKPHCFQGKYPKYYNALELDLTDMYYWGKLNDQYVEGVSKVR